MNRAQLPSGIATGIGSLPHRDAADAADFALATLELPAIPTLPKRSPAEGMIAQAMVGSGRHHRRPVRQHRRRRHRFDPDGSGRHRSRPRRVRRLPRVPRRAAVAEAPVKWQFVGPVTLGLALVRAGLDTDVAFEASVRAVRCHVRQLVEHVAAGAARLPAAGVHRRTVARRADGRRVPDRPRHGDRPGVGRAGRDRAGRRHRPARVRQRRHRLARGRRPGRAVRSRRAPTSSSRPATSSGSSSAAAGSPGVRSPPTARSSRRPSGRGASSSSCGASWSSAAPTRPCFASSRSSPPSAVSARTPRPWPSGCTGWPPRSASGSGTRRRRRASSLGA